MNEFKINDLLKLKLETGKTIIYIKDKRVIQCKYLLINDPVNFSDESLSQPEKNPQNITLDEQVERLDRSLELDTENEYEIPPEAEFWAHSSNLQAWYENNYDTEILHSNLAFPLLRKLSKAGDKVAKEIFNKEIKKRFRRGNLNVMTFLVKEGYLEHLDIEDHDKLYQELDFEILKELQKHLKKSSKEKEGFLI